MGIYTITRVVEFSIINKIFKNIFKNPENLQEFLQESSRNPRNSQLLTGLPIHRFITRLNEAILSILSEFELSKFL